MKVNRGIINSKIFKGQENSWQFRKKSGHIQDPDEVQKIPKSQATYNICLAPSEPVLSLITIKNLPQP